MRVFSSRDLPKPRQSPYDRNCLCYIDCAYSRATGKNRQQRFDDAMPTAPSFPRKVVTPAEAGAGIHAAPSTRATGQFPYYSLVICPRRFFSATDTTNVDPERLVTLMTTP